VIVAEDLPAPLVPSDVDLRRFPSMPLDVRRLRDSKFAAAVDGESFRAGVLLWAAAWHERPAGSLPNDDVELAQLAGFGRAVSEWQKVREGALYGWRRCSDNRLYHEFLAGVALDSWERKLAQLARTRAATDAHARKRSAGLKQSDVDDKRNEGRDDDRNEGRDDDRNDDQRKGIEQKGMERNGKEGERVNPAGKPANACPPCPHERIIEAYHEILPMLPRVRVWNEPRQRLLRARWRERFERGRFADVDGGVAWSRGFFEHVKRSRFLTGQAEGRSGRSPFVANLEWLLRQDHFANVIEGMYHDA
jgi:hypothetical protein